jgi:hypothetical protein
MGPARAGRGRTARSNTGGRTVLIESPGPRPEEAQGRFVRPEDIAKVLGVPVERV